MPTCLLASSIHFRLLMYNADLACGLDIFLEPDPHKYLRKGQPEAAEIRRELTFYDTWVARDAHGRRFQWGPPFVQRRGAGGGAEEEADRCVRCVCLARKGGGGGVCPSVQQ